MSELFKNGDITANNSCAFLHQVSVSIEIAGDKLLEKGGISIQIKNDLIRYSSCLKDISPD